MACRDRSKRCNQVRTKWLEGYCTKCLYGDRNNELGVLFYKMALAGLSKMALVRSYCQP